ncbi:MAG: succinyl-diaminopimelate desuccinylase [bacterium]
MSDVIKLAIDLIERQSVTPQDGGCQLLLTERLQKRGFDCQQIDFEEVKNLFAVHGESGPLFVFLGHTDVVPTGPEKHWITPPFKADIRHGQLYGRGSADMKGSVAAMTIALEKFVNKYPEHPGRVALLLTSDEEGPAQNGIKKVIPYLQEQGIEIDYCLVGEPSSLDQLGDVVRIGRRGSINVHFSVNGKQGHTAYPDQADNAIHKAMLVLTELSQLQIDQGSDEFPASSLQFSNVRSGTGATNVIPGELSADFNIRHGTISPEPLIKQKVVEIIEKHLSEYQLDWKPSGAPFLTKSGKLRNAVVSTIEQQLSIKPDANTGGGTSDGRFVAPTGAQVVELGPINSSIHQINEHVGVQELIDLVDCYEIIIEKTLLDPLD